MIASPPALPRRKADLVLGPPDSQGKRVIKDIDSGNYFQLGPEESFLLDRLDGQSVPLEIRAAFEDRFGDPLSEADLEGFLQLAREQEFLDDDDESKIPLESHDDSLLQSLKSWPILQAAKDEKKSKEAFDPLNIKIHLYDPAKLFELIYPSLKWIWTKAFLVFLFVAAAAAGVLAWECRTELASQIPTDFGWKTILLGWLVLVVVTTFHEFAHGLTCKHFGGEVHDVGFIVILVLPSFYCNVSDAWLIPERWKRLAITFAGSGCDLAFWTLGVFAWRLTVPQTLVNQVAWFLISICGVRILLNFNPLIKLDGYYLAVDFLQIPNLRQRSLDHFKSMIRWGLWGASRPAREESEKTLAVFGMATWIFSVGLLSTIFGGFVWYTGSKWGIVAVVACLFFGLLMGYGLFRGFAQGEISAMFKHRRGRVSVWAVVGVSTVVGLAGIPVEDRPGGEFHIRPTSKAVLRSPVTGFLREVAAGEGGRISPGQMVARLEVPDLESRLTQKAAEINESKARLKLLKAGPRPEEVAEQKRGMTRAQRARDRASHELERAKLSLKEELLGLDLQISQAVAERERAEEMLRRDRLLIKRNAIEADTVRDTQKAYRVAGAQLAQAESRKRGRESDGTLKAEAELAQREAAIAAAEGELRLLEAGNRPEEIDAEASRLSRLEEELHYLERVSSRLRVVSPLRGVITTPRLEERVGRFFQEGEIIAEVEADTYFEAEITLKEYDITRVRKGMRVDLKPRALLFRSFETVVDRIGIASSSASSSASGSSAAPSMTPEAVAAAAAAATDKTCSFIVYCKLSESAAPELRTGMTGYGRITVSKSPIIQVYGCRFYRMIRNEFWW